MNLAFSHEPGTAISCLSIPIVLHKEGGPGLSELEMKCGFKIGGGIDQDYRKSPQVSARHCNLKEAACCCRDTRTTAST